MKWNCPGTFNLHQAPATNIIICFPFHVAALLTKASPKDSSEGDGNISDNIYIESFSDHFKENNWDIDIQDTDYSNNKYESEKEDSKNAPIIPSTSNEYNEYNEDNYR